MSTNKKNIKADLLRKEAREFILKLGYTRIAFLCQIESQAVRKWCENGIPEKYWVTLFSIAPDLRVDTLHKWNEAIRAAKGQK